MKVTYLYHSGFAVELTEHILIFDYCKGNLPGLRAGKDVLFFASHKHPDHFDWKIFDFFQGQEKIHYFLGSDIRFNDNYLRRRGIDPSVRPAVTRIGADTAICRGDVTVETLRSTDAGVAFIVTTEGKTIYHGGDLNWWHWAGETDVWNRQMEADYKKEMAKIKGRHFDVAFVPLDPRLEQAYGLGMEVFLQNADADVVFPMHMWDAYHVISRFRKSSAGRNYAHKIYEIAMPGEEFII